MTVLILLRLFLLGSSLGFVGRAVLRLFDFLRMSLYCFVFAFIFGLLGFLVDKHEDGLISLTNN